MKEKQYDPAGKNEKSPAKGMASVDSFNPDEEKLEGQQEKDKSSSEDEAQHKTNVGSTETDSV